MIEATHDIEIIDPDIVICTLDDSAKISMEMTVDLKGYVPAAENRAEDAPIAWFPSTPCSARCGGSLPGRKCPRRAADGL